MMSHPGMVSQYHTFGLSGTRAQTESRETRNNSTSAHVQRRVAHRRAARTTPRGKAAQAHNETGPEHCADGPSEAKRARHTLFILIPTIYDCLSKAAADEIHWAIDGIQRTRECHEVESD